jgi:DNA-binding transcriptional regulator YiaG
MPSNPEVERKIATRFAELRSLRNFSLSEFAKEIGLTKDQVSNVERARSPLRYVNARRALQAVTTNNIHRPPYLLPFNPLWLSGTSDWPIQLDWPILLPMPESIGLDFTLRFSQFVQDHLPLLQIFASDNPENARLPESWLEPYAYHWAVYTSNLGKALKVRDALFEIVAVSARDKAAVSSPARRVLQSLKKTGQGLAWIEYSTGIRIHEDKLPPPNLSKKDLAEIRELANMPGMQSDIEGLRRRLNRATAQRGVKTALAVYLTVPLSCVSDWLSGKREPGGDTTLKLLRWVMQQEAQQKQSPGSAETPPGPTTQSKKANEKQSKSGLPKT